MPRSILFVTLDSCRYDAFVEARAPNLKSLAPLCRAQSPSHFTYGSHSAFFMGFTPGDASRREPYVNPKFGKIFRMEGGGHPGAARPHITLSGHNIVSGLKNSGFRAIGSGAVRKRWPVRWTNTSSRVGLPREIDSISSEKASMTSRTISCARGRSILSVPSTI